MAKKKEIERFDQGEDITLPSPKELYEECLIELVRMNREQWNLVKREKRGKREEKVMTYKDWLEKRKEILEDLLSQKSVGT